MLTSTCRPSTTRTPQALMFCIRNANRYHSHQRGEDAGCYSTGFNAGSAATSDDALDLAMQFGKDIIEGKVHATAP